MTPEIEKLENSIKKIHRVAFTPKFKDTFTTKLSKSAFIATSLKAIEDIGWELIYYDDSNIEAKRKGDWGTYTEGITIHYDLGKVRVESTSLGNEMWDFGRNSKRVKLFELVIGKLSDELSDEEVEGLASEIQKTEEWADYEIPETLPAPPAIRKPNILIPLLSAFGASLILGYIFAQCISEGLYFIGLFDVGVGFLIGIVMSSTLRAGNYTNFDSLRLVLIASIIIAFVSSQLFIYQNFLNQFPTLDIGFIKFMQLRFEAGLTIKEFDTGWVGLLISWGLFLFFGYYLGLLRLISGVVNYQLERVPTEVLDFAFYLLKKEHSLDEVKTELAKKGWSSETDYSNVMEAIGALGDAQSMRRS